MFVAIVNHIHEHAIVLLHKNYHISYLVITKYNALDFKEDKLYMQLIVLEDFN